MALRFLSTSLTVALLVGCSVVLPFDYDVEDASASMDANVRRDAGRLDEAGVDSAGNPLDSGGDPLDAGVDAGDPLDAGACFLEGADCEPFGGDCEPGEGCYPDGGLWFCLGPGTAATGETCALSEDCLEGLVCAGARCRAYCDNCNPCSERSACALVQDVMGPVLACSENCLPGTSAGCDSPSRCDVRELGAGLGPVCLSGGGAAAQNMPCSNDDTCRPGFDCDDTYAPTGRCRQWCTVLPATAVPCPMGYRCEEIPEHPVFGGEEFGVCVGS